MVSKRIPKWMMEQRKPAVDYMMFCDSCGSPKKLSSYTLLHINGLFKNHQIAHIYCNNCKNKQILPETLLKIMDDLLGAL